MGLRKTHRKQSSCSQHASACDLRTLSSRLSAAADSLPPDLTQSKSSLNEPYSHQRAKSHTLLNTNGHQIKRMPNHIMPELLHDLSRSASHISLDLSSSEEDGNPLEQAQPVRNLSKQNQSSSVVTPEAPKVIIFNPKSINSQSKSTINMSTKRDSTNSVTNSEAAQTLNSTHRILVPRQNLLQKKISWLQRGSDQNLKELSGTGSLPSYYQIRTSSGTRSSIARTVSNDSRPGSAEDFMQDATMSLTRAEYDPFGLVRRNFNDWFSDPSHTQTNNATSDSRTSSGQFSFSSIQSMQSNWSLPQAVDRRRRRRPKLSVDSAS